MTTTALITGATSGIGRAAADKLAQSGVHVMVVGRNVERGEKTIAEIRAAGGKADFISSDLRDAASARAVARKAVELGGGHVDILINNAGIFPFGPTHEMSEESFDDVYALNVKASYFLVAELAPLMAQRGKGAIVNVSTMVADYGAAGLSLYGSSKAAINLLTKAWAAEYGPKGVRVNAVSPGPTRTEGTAAMGDALQQLAAQAPAGRPAAPEEIAEAIVFLATDRASFVQGAILPVDGGRTAVMTLGGLQNPPYQIPVETNVVSACGGSGQKRQQAIERRRWLAVPHDVGAVVRNALRQHVLADVGSRARPPERTWAPRRIRCRRRRRRSSPDTRRIPGSARASRWRCPAIPRCACDRSSPARRRSVSSVRGRPGRTLCA